MNKCKLLSYEVTRWYSTFNTTPEVPMLHNALLSWMTPAPIAPHALSPPPAYTATSLDNPNSLASDEVTFPTYECDFTRVDRYHQC